MTRNEFNRAVTVINTNNYLRVISKKRQKDVSTVAFLAADSAMYAERQKYLDSTVGMTEEEAEKAFKDFEASKVYEGLNKIISGKGDISTLREVFKGGFL